MGVCLHVAGVVCDNCRSTNATGHIGVHPYPPATEPTKKLLVEDVVPIDLYAVAVACLVRIARNGQDAEALEAAKVLLELDDEEFGEEPDPED